MKWERIVVPLLIILSLVAISMVQEKKMHSYVVNGRRYLFQHSIDDVMDVRIEPSAKEIRDFFDSSDEFVIMFNGSSPRDNGLFAKHGFNLATRIVRYYGDIGVVKRVSALNGTGKEIWFFGPETGGKEMLIVLRNSTLEVHGRSRREFEKAADALGFIILGLYPTAQAS